MTLPNLLKKVPGARNLFRSLTGADQQGAWLFQAKTHRWLSEDELRHQLPNTYRLLARFYLAQRYLPGPAFGGSRAFDLVCYVARIQGIDALNLSINGVHIYLNPFDPRMLQVPNELVEISSPDSFLAQYLNLGDTFIDIGANHGAFSLAASQFVGHTGIIYAFEPQPKLNALIKKSFQANQIENSEVFSFACSNQEGNARFFIPRASSGQAGLHSRFSATASHDELNVRLVRLDNLLSDRKIMGTPFIKLDVEGNELAVLQGANSFIRTHKPSIYMEVNPQAMQAAGTSTEALINHLRTLDCLGFSRPSQLMKKIIPLEELRTDHHQNIILRFSPSKESSS